MSGPVWCTIESDPGVFTDLIEEIGVKDVEVNECFSLDDIKLYEQTVHGLIFLFKWRQEEDPRPVVMWRDVDVFFARQVINNACATQAILSVLLNSPSISLGDTLQNFKDFTKYLDPELRGESINNSDVLRTAHNSFSQQHAFSLEDSHAKGDDDVFHFISYVPVNGRLYELDGLKAGPIDLGDCNEQNWKDRVSVAIGARIQRYSAAEIRFNLLAVVDSLKPTLQRRLDALRAQFPTPESRTPEIQHEIGELTRAITIEEQKRAQWKTENIRRKHNYVPFVINLLKVLAERNQLQPLVDKAKAEQAAKKAKKEAQ